MIRWRKGTVVKIRREWPGAVELDVEIENDGASRALAYPELVGSPQPGDEVLLNTTALAMGLGTGGYAMVVAVPDRFPPDPSGPGHLVKARYTPLQATVLGADEQDSAHHELLREADSVGGMPVIVADLHSALPAIIAGLHLERPGTRVVYVMPDGGALPSWFSRSAATLRETGALSAVVTVGQAFGGDLEAVTLHTGLLAARLVLDAEVVVVAQGPGNLGTGTRWGFSGVSAGEAVNAASVLAVDEDGSPHRAAMVAAGGLDGLPVVTADLHSAVPAILAGVHADRPDARVAYVMTDGGALPAWFSRTIDALAGRLAGVVTVGQAFGGDLEAVNVHSGLLAARHVLGADIAIVAQGPGNLGTGTPWGFSGVATGEAVNAAAVLDGRPVGALRISDADPRPRHRGISHHSLTAYGRVALAPADLVVPDGLPAALAAEVADGLATMPDRHRVVRVATVGLDPALRALPVTLSTMGRDLDADHAYFLAAAAAGRHAAGLLLS